MITGFNTDIEFEGKTYHVQTEDKGLSRPVIMSLIYDRGTILASKRSPYDDLVAGDAVDESALAERLNKQHKLICAAVRTGRIDDLIKMSAGERGARALNGSVRKSRPNCVIEAPEDDSVAASEPEPKPVAKPGDLPLNAYEIIEEEIVLPEEAVEIVSEMVGRERPANDRLSIELLGESRFRGGEHRTVTLMVCRGSQSKVVPDATVMIKVLGSCFRPLIFHARTDANGMARVNLQFPTFSEGRAALLIRASSDGSEVELRRTIAHG